MNHNEKKNEIQIKYFMLTWKDTSWLKLFDRSKRGFFQFGSKAHL